MKTPLSTRTSPRATVILLLVLLLGAQVFSTAVFAKDAPAEVLAALPATFGTFVADDEGQTYDSPELGASRAYRLPSGTWISVYLYDLGHKTIRKGVEDKVIKDAAAQSKEDILEMERQGHYSDVKMAEDSKVTVDLESGQKLSFFSVTYSLAIVNKDTSKKTKLFSQLLVTGLRDHILKIRVSRPDGRDASPPEETEQALKGIIQAVAAAP